MPKQPAFPGLRDATKKKPGKDWGVMRKATKGGELHPLTSGPTASLPRCVPRSGIRSASSSASSVM